MRRECALRAIQSIERPDSALKSVVSGSLSLVRGAQVRIGGLLADLRSPIQVTRGCPGSGCRRPSAASSRFLSDGKVDAIGETFQSLLHGTAQGDTHNEKWFSRRSAIKNSADEDPEGYSTVLDAPLCNGGLVLPFKSFLSDRMSTRLGRC